MELVNTWVRNIVVYMILNTIIMNLLGDKSYKKYVSIVSGMVLLLIVVTPLLKLTNLEESLDYFLKSNEYSVEASEFKNDINRMEKEQRELIFTDYKKKLKIQVTDLLSEEGYRLIGFAVTIEESPSSTNFGELLAMDIAIGAMEEAAEEDSSHFSVDSIDKIEIPRIDKNEKKAEQMSPSPLQIQLKKRLADFYNIGQDNINITIQG